MVGDATTSVTDPTAGDKEGGTDRTTIISNAPNTTTQAMNCRNLNGPPNGQQSLTGAQTFLAIRGYISTTRKNGLRAATELHNALLGKPWMPPTAA